MDVVLSNAEERGLGRIAVLERNTWLGGQRGPEFGRYRQKGVLSEASGSASFPSHSSKQGKVVEAMIPSSRRGRPSVRRSDRYVVIAMPRGLS